MREKSWVLFFALFLNEEMLSSSINTDTNILASKIYKLASATWHSDWLTEKQIQIISNPATSRGWKKRRRHKRDQQVKVKVK